MSEAIKYAANLVLFGHDHHGTAHVLTVTRGGKAFPGKQCLPGGHVEPGERGWQTAIREGLEETGYDAGRSGHPLTQVYFDDDPEVVEGRGRYITVAYGRQLPDYGLPAVTLHKGADDVRAAQWVPLSKADLIFDHNEIVRQAKVKLGVTIWPTSPQGIRDMFGDRP